MTQEYEAFLKKSLDLKAIREARSKDVSRDKLFKTAKKKIQTTMIGALSTLEEGFGFLWRFECDDEDKTPEQKHIHDIYEDVRAKILDRGNTQIRSLESEFINYEIVRKKHFISLPVSKPKGEDNNDGQ
jgi:transcription termination factor Rho